MINKTLLPSSANIKTAVTGAVSTVTGQLSSNFAKTGANALKGELASKLSSSGLANQFGKLASDVNLKEKNGKIVATFNLENGPSGDFLAEVPLQDVARGTESEQLPNTKSDVDGRFKITLRPIPSLGDNDTITLDVMPSISESHGASYESVDLLQHPGEILKYKSTSARAWGLTADLVSRTSQEATRNKEIINLIRSWLMPFYGNGTADSYASRLGAPPQVIELSGFGTKMIGPVTCVLENFSWTFENNMDYIPTEAGEPFPVLVKASLNFKETWTPREFTNFDLMKYRAGELPAAFGQAGQASSSGNTNSDKLPANGISGPDTIDTSSPVTITREAAGSVSSIYNNAMSGVKNTVSGITGTKQIISGGSSVIRYADGTSKKLPGPLPGLGG